MAAGVRTGRLQRGMFRAVALAVVCALAALSAPAPAVADASAPLRYLVGVTSQAQSRAGGGVLDAVAIVRVSAGRVSIERIMDAAGLPANTVAPVGLDPGYYRLFGHSLTSWPELSLAPDGPTVGRSWLQAWRNTTGQQLDGAVALDSNALASLMHDMGVTLRTRSGRVLSATAAINDELAFGMHRRALVFGSHQNFGREQNSWLTGDG